jgi:hypothetical protein
MKILRLLLALSLAANLTLAVLLSRTGKPTPALPSAAAATPTPAPPSPSPITAAPSPPTELAADDFTGLSTRLAAAGIPDHLAKMAVMFAIKQHFDARRLQLALRADPAGFTRHPITNATSESAEIQAARRALDREEQETLQEHLGDDRVLSTDRMRHLTGSLPPEKSQRLLKIVADYRQMEAQLYLENPDRGAPANRERVALLQKEQRADIERLLSPAELLDYDLRTSALGGQIRNRIGHFVVSETEFRTLFSAFQQAEAAADAAGVPRRARDRDAVFEPAFRRVLGDARYADLQRARQDEADRVRSFTETMSLTRKLNLPSTAPNDLLVLQAGYRPLLAALRSAQQATPAETEARIAELRTEAERKLEAILGADGLAVYRTGAGQWLGGAGAPR